MGDEVLGTLVHLGYTSRLAPVVNVARMIHSHLDNVLTYFDPRITNATSEGLNSKIQTVKQMPVGFAIGST